MFGKNKSIGIILILIAFTVCGCYDPSYIPPPTNGTYVTEDMEEGKNKDLKKRWFEELHSCDSTTDWRAIEAQNSFKKYQKNQARQNKNLTSISVGEGVLIGHWEEKGSTNQSGNVMRVRYNDVDRKLYAISDGGTLWKGDINGNNWEVVMEQLRFDGRSLEINYPPTSQWRILTSINGIPHFQDKHKEWTRATLFPTVSRTINKDVSTLLSGKEIYYLAHIPNTQKIHLYYSSDYGETYQSVHTFYTSDLDNVALAVDNESDALFAIEQTGQSTSRLFRFNRGDTNLTLMVASSPQGFGEYGKANLEIHSSGNRMTLYSYNDKKELKSSIDQGVTWQKISNLNIQPWDCGLFISKTHPGLMMIGGIEAYKSLDMGLSWEKCNSWTDYYTNINTALHADIMDFYEVNAAGLDLIFVSNHGGISSTVDKAFSFQNIGLEGLNASQYYSARTYPNNPAYIIAGSQDQGLQKGLDLDEGAIAFDQFIAGDYGHLQFTNYGRSMWAVYPLGWIVHYPDPINNSRYKKDYELLISQERQVWLPQMLTSPYNPNAILMSGNLPGTVGSHIVQVSIDDLGQFFGNQWGFDFSEDGGEISAMAYNKQYINEFYVTTTTGAFYKSTDSGLSFERLGLGLPEGHHLYGNVILTSQRYPNRIIVGGAGYDNPGILISYDRGESFVPMVNNLDPTTVLDLEYDASEAFLFAATEAGPYICSLEKQEWQDLSLGQAPDQRFWSVEYIAESNKARFATYGRGIWDFNIEVLTSQEELVTTDQISVYPNPAMDNIFVEHTKQKGKLQILSTNGQIVKEVELQNQEKSKIDISTLSEGLYYLIFDNGSQTISNRFVKI